MSRTFANYFLQMFVEWTKINPMTFSQLLSHFRERSKYSKTELATKLGLTPPYIMHLESGSKKPSTIERCREISKALSLSEQEEMSLCVAAAEERVNPEDLAVLRSAPHATKKVIIRIDEKGNAHIVSKDPGVSVVIEYDDEITPIGKPKDHKDDATIHKIISKHSHHVRPPALKHHKAE